MPRHPPAEQSRTLLISLGGAEYPSAPHFRHSAFEPSSRAIAEVLGNTGLGLVEPEDHLSLFDAAASWPDQLIKIRDWIRVQAQSTSKPSNILIHYVGHGSFKPNSTDYFLTINRTDAEDSSATSVSMAELHGILSRNAGMMRIFLVIDACFAAAAVKDLQSGTASDLVRARMAEIIKDDDQGDTIADRGIAALCSADKFEGASARGRDGLTQFTDGLLTVLRTGDAATSRPLSMARVAHLMRKVLREHYGEEAIMPILHAPESARGKISEYLLFTNCAARNVRDVLSDLPQEVRKKLKATTSNFAKELFNLANSPSEFERKCEEIRGMGRKQVAEIEECRTKFDVGYDVTQVLDRFRLFLDQSDPSSWRSPLSALRWAAALSPAYASGHLASQFAVGSRTQLLDELGHIKNEALMDTAALDVRRSHLARARDRLAQMAYIAVELKAAFRQQERRMASKRNANLDIWARPNRILDENTQDILTALTDADRFQKELVAAKDETFRRIKTFDVALSKAAVALSRVAALAGAGVRESRKRSRELLREISFEIGSLRTLLDEMKPAAIGVITGDAGPRKIAVPPNMERVQLPDR
jgi:hypothetical protein